MLGNEVSWRSAVWIVPSATLGHLGVAGAVLGRETQESGQEVRTLRNLKPELLLLCDPKKSCCPRRLWESRGSQCDFSCPSLIGSGTEDWAVCPSFRVSFRYPLLGSISRLASKGGSSYETTALLSKTLVIIR